MNAHVAVSGLEVVAHDSNGAEKVIVADVKFRIAKGQVLALIGESGSGKTTIALSLMGYTREGCRIRAGSIRIGETEVLALPKARLSSLRGRRVSYVAQSAAAAFNPSRTIMTQVIEPAIIHGVGTAAQARSKAEQLFEELALPEPRSIGARYPHQVSGGQLQRLMAAMALITKPELVIFDEPTSSLDVTTQIEVLRAFKRVIRERDITAIYVSHDLAVVTQMAGQVVVLRSGRIQESGPMEQIIHHPENAYTQTLLAAARPAPRTEAISLTPPTPLLEIKGLEVGYGKMNAQGKPAAPVLGNINLVVHKGSAVGVIGESGSGKSTLARAIAGLLSPANGSIALNGEPLGSSLAQRSREQFRRIQIVFQNADTALNPSHQVDRILARPLEFYHGYKGQALSRRIVELLDLVQLPKSISSSRGGSLSGGQKQRLNLARALAAEPELILCDEVTSALDTVVGAAILKLMAQLRRELSVSYLFISHNISTVRAICDDILVLYAGDQVEFGSSRNFLQPPFHPYTGLLINSVPEIETGWLEKHGPVSAPRELVDITPRAADLCRFLDRCPVRIDGLCNHSRPPHVTTEDGGQVLCHHSETQLLELAARSMAR